jgi:hypothetical protein
VYRADSPLTCVATGAGQSLEELPIIHRAAARGGDARRRRSRASRRR